MWHDPAGERETRRVGRAGRGPGRGGPGGGRRPGGVRRRRHGLPRAAAGGPRLPAAAPHGPDRGGRRDGGGAAHEQHRAPGLLAFTGIEPLRRWDADARPLPVRAREAAEAALAERAEAVVLDVAGPTRVVIDGEDLAAIARGRTLGFVGDRPAWVPA
ncbi:MAG: SseB family protein [Nocardioides sp.]